MADPFVAMNSIQAANRNESLPLFVEYGYDFDKQCFRYLAYDDSYGITIEPYQGRAPNSQYTADRICQNIREGLMVNPYIARINHIEVKKRERDDLAITVDVTSIYSDESLTVTAGRSEA